MNCSFCSERDRDAAATAAAKIVHAFEWPEQPPKLPLPPDGGSAPPVNIWFLWPTRLFSKTVSRSLRLAVFVWVPNAIYAVQCIVNGEENPQNCLFPLGFRHPAGRVLRHDNRQHVHKIGKKIARFVRYARRQIDRHVQTPWHTDRHTDRHAHYNTTPTK